MHEWRDARAEMRRCHVIKLFTIFYVDVFYVNISYIPRLIKQYRNMSNKKDLDLSIFEFATQFKLLVGFIIAHDLRRHSISATYRCRTG